MKYLLLDGFPRGLDARKFTLSAPAGTLVELHNGHLTNGGEIEKRKAFVEYANVAIAETGATLTAGVRTFGMQATLAGLTVFGSALPNGVSPGATAQPVLASAMPSGITYQQLQHPAVTDGETYVAATHAMTAVLKSWTYGGLIYALATYADGNTFGFYNGTLARDFTDGLIMAHMNTNVKIAKAITEMFNRSEDYTATQLANPNDHKTNATGPLGESFSTSVLDDSAGTLAGDKVSDPTAATEARQAIGSFQIIAGSYSAGTNKITKVEIGPSGGAFVEITNAAVDWTNSNEFTAALLAASINTKSSTPEYTAEATGATVTIKALPADGDASNNYVVRVTAAGDVCVGKVQFQIQRALTFNITALMINGVDQLIDTSAGDIDVTVDNIATAAAAIAAAINANTTAGQARGYVANATGSVISIAKAVTRSDDPDLPVYFIHNGTAGSGVFEVGGGGGSVPTIALLLVFVGRTLIGSRYPYTVRWNLTLAISGGIAPYLAPVWNTTVIAVGGGQYYVEGYIYAGESLTPPPPHVYCTVTDSGGQAATSNTI
jgi:hypothetical protein